MKSRMGRAVVGLNLFLSKGVAQSHRIMEPFSLGKTSKLTQSNHYPSSAKPITNPHPQVPHPHILNPSRNSEFTTSLGSLFQFLTPLSVNELKCWPQKSMENINWISFPDFCQLTMIGTKYDFKIDPKTC